MTTAHLQFDFIVDKAQNTITVRREFRANRQLVWDCHTKSELLNQWFAPQPFTTKTKHMDFRSGGYWHYAMVDPTGVEYWCRMDYETVQPIEGYTGLDGFSDANGALNAELPRAHWNATFSDLEANTLVQTVVTYNSLSDLETVIQMGMQEGITSTLERLDAFLLTLNS